MIKRPTMMCLEILKKEKKRKERKSQLSGFAWSRTGGPQNYKAAWEISHFSIHGLCVDPVLLLS